MSGRVTAFYIENFKAYRKGRWFDFNEITMLTGANSSGKSTLFKAIQFFSNAFKDSDFPEIELSQTISIGSIVKLLLNNHTDKEYFKLGFRYYSSFLEKEVDSIFRFGLSEQGNGKIKVSELSIKVGSREIITFYSSDEVTEMTGFKPILEDYDDPSELTITVNIKEFSKMIGDVKRTEAKRIISYLKDKFGDLWMLEAVSNDKYGNPRDRMRIDEEIFSDLKTDFYCNLYTNIEKESILRIGEAEKEKIYINLSKELGYENFTDEMIKPIFQEISAAIRFFYQKHVIHIDFKDSILNRVISIGETGDTLPLIDDSNADLILQYVLNNKYNPKIKYKEIEKGKSEIRVLKRCEGRVNWGSLFDIFQQKSEDEVEIKSDIQLSGFGKELYRFIGDSFLIFEIKKGIKIDKPINGANIILLHNGVHIEQLVDLGRGEARIIEMILHIGYQLFEKNEKKNKKPENDLIQTIIHIEEPEAYLHPKWQSRLADYFVYLAANFDVQLMVETHSVYLIQKLQLMVARDQFNPLKISILYFNQNRKDVTYRQITMRSDGMLREGFGEGFYDESAMLTIDLLNTQSKN